LNFIRTSILFLLLSQISGFSISGFIRDNSNGEPLPYANIIVSIDEIGTSADVNGYYILTNLKSGNYTLRVMMIGYETKEIKTDITDVNKRIDIELNPTQINLDEITVSAERMRFENRVDVSRVNLTNQEIRRAPAFIEADVFRTLQLLPSVSSSNDFNAALIVRGGSPDENLILLDGAEVYNPYHIGGVFSTFNADMISDTEFLAGGFPSQYGGRLSSVLKITAREGNSKNGRLSDSNPLKKYWDYSKIGGDISLLSSKFLAEGALYNGSWMISGRRTYFDQFVNLYYKFKNEESPFNYYFWDTHIKLKSSPNKYNQLIYSQFSGKDDLYLSLGGGDFPGINFSWDWRNSTKSLIWKYIPNSNYFIENNLSRTDYIFNVDFAVDFNPDTTNDNNEDISENDVDLSLDINNIVTDLSFDQTLNIFFSDNLTMKTGWEYKILYMDYFESFAGTERVNLNSEPSITSMFLTTTWQPFSKLHLNTGLRFSKFSQYNKNLFNPRIGLKFNPISDLALKVSWGKYSQFLYTINQEDELLRIVDFWQPIPEGSEPQQSEHLIVGSEYWISEGNIFSLELYTKTYGNIYDLNPKVEGSDIEHTIALSGIGKSYGLEILYRLKKDKISGWISYAFAKIEREVDLNSDGVIWEEKEIYPAKYDKPHTFNSVISYQFSEKNEFGISTIFSSGQTYTPVIGKVHQAGQYGSLENPYRYFGNRYGARNSGRYPAYFRIDVSYARKSTLWGLNGKWKFQIINLTNHYNVLLYNWNHQASPSQVSAYSMFPILLTFGWEFNL